MLPLLRKDWYVIRSQMILYAVIWAVMAGMLAWIPERHLSLSIPLLSANLVVTTIDADERWRWDRFAAMTPLRPWRIVLAKYIFAYSVLALIVVVGLLSGWVSTLGKGGLSLWFEAAAVLLELATWLPLRYRFERGKSNIFPLLLWGAFAALLLNPWGLEIAEFLFGWMEGVPRLALILGGGLCLAGLHIGSIFLSIRFYTRRRRGWYD